MATYVTNQCLLLSLYSYAHYPLLQFISVTQQITFTNLSYFPQLFTDNSQIS